jgi:tRNA(Arg) A34 adenosine deaminase TadA
MDDMQFMTAALDEARRAEARGEVPIGAVLVNPATGEIVARDGNRTIEYSDPTAHAEINVIRAACRQTGAQRIPSYDLYVTLEPCTMCTASVSFARIRRLIIGALDPKGGGVIHGARFFDQPTCHHRSEIVHGILQEPCGQILKDFFKHKRSRAER